MNKLMRLSLALHKKVKADQLFLQSDESEVKEFKEKLNKLSDEKEIELFHTEHGVVSQIGHDINKIEVRLVA